MGTCVVIGLSFCSLPTPTVWFSLDRKRRSLKRGKKKMETFWFFRLWRQCVKGTIFSRLHHFCGRSLSLIACAPEQNRHLRRLSRWTSFSNRREPWERGWRRAIARRGVKEVKAQLNIPRMNLDTHFFQYKVLSPFNLEMKISAISGEEKLSQYFIQR